MELLGLKEIVLVLVPKGILTLENTESLAFKIVWVLKGTRFMNL